VRYRQRGLLAGCALAGIIAACSTSSGAGAGSPRVTSPPSQSAPRSAHDGGAVLAGSGSPTPAATGTGGVDIYAHTRVGMFTDVARAALPRVYVPNLSDGTVSVIDPATYRIVDTIKVGVFPQHVVPAWDEKTLLVNNNESNTLTPIDPLTAKRAGPDIPVEDPYNLYFTLDGTSAIVMAEAKTNLDFYDPHTWKLQTSLHLGDRCAGVNHADFSADGSYLLATCEFAGRVVKIDVAHRKVLGYVDLGPQSAPQDIKLDPSGQIWYVADMNANGVHELTGEPFAKVGFLPTGPETHGLYPSRDGTRLYVPNRGGARIPGAAFSQHEGNHGSVSVIDFATRKVVASWPIPGGGTPDMGNVSADGTRLWLSGRRSNEVYVLDTATGALVTRIPVGRQPHGLAVWPLPGRFSLGHTGILR
jgi:YVTN family beta-propeller protein